MRLRRLPATPPPRPCPSSLFRLGGYNTIFRRIFAHSRERGCVSQIRAGDRLCNSGSQEMSDAVFKKIQVVGTSPVSFADAAAKAVAKVAETEKKASWFEVVELRGAIADGKVSQYQVTVNIGCKLD